MLENQEKRANENEAGTERAVAASKTPAPAAGKGGNRVTNVGYIAIGIVVGLVLGIGGALFFQNYNPKDEKTGPDVLAASVVFDRIVTQDKLVSASQAYNIVEKAGTSGTIPFTDIPIPFTDNSFWYRYSGVLEAAVDLKTATFEQKDSTLVITLDNPFISSNTPDMDKSGVLEENNNILNPIHVEDIDAFQAQCLKTSEEEAVNGGLLDEARTNAEQDIRSMFYAAYGDSYSIEFVWRDSQ